MLREGVIEPALSEGVSPMVLVPKKNGNLRFCVRYSKLNAMTVRDIHSLPQMDGYIESLKQKTFFRMDCNSKYWQTEKSDADRDKIT